MRTACLSGKGFVYAAKRRWNRPRADLATVSPVIDSFTTKDTKLTKVGPTGGSQPWGVALVRL